MKNNKINNYFVDQKADNYEKEMALKTIYKKMALSLRKLNLAANVGLKNKEEFDEISKIVDDFISTKIENELEFDDELLKKFNEVMAAFRYTLQELFIKIQNKKFNEGLNGLRSFDFIEKCEEAVKEIKRRLE